jgi:hypothetical protein
VSEFISIAGYGVPFGKTVLWGDDWIKIEPTAFDAMLASAPPSVPLLWGSHDDEAPPVARSGTLFVDQYGLGFAATLDMRNTGGRISSNWGLLRQMTQRVAPLDQCSLNMIIDDERRVPYPGGVCRHVTRASFDHIAIVQKGAWGTGTGVWPTDRPIEDAPWHIRQMAARWECGREEFQLRAKRQRLLAASESIAKGKGHGIGGDLSDGQVATINSNIAQMKAVDHTLSRLRGGAFNL